MVSFDVSIADTLHEDPAKLIKSNQAKDKRLRKLYGITLETRTHMELMQDNLCAICKNPPGTKSLAVDHDHKWKYLKIHVAELSPDRFVASIQEPTVATIYRCLRGHGTSKKEARNRLKDLLKRASVRGLLCFSCNGGLRKYRDNPDYLASAAAYLRTHQRGEW